jgi:hypothetical protein
MQYVRKYVKDLRAKRHARDLSSYMFVAVRGENKGKIFTVTSFLFYILYILPP